ncbi:MAG: hypothetical protein RL065_715 [Bacteroidota bacterium]|jgi:hypothetical protein
MQNIEPFYNWLDIYTSEEDEQSPFYGREHSEFEYSNTIYNHYIHPQWDFFGSATLYMKVLYADYLKGFAIMEFIGEWNDCIGNDIMFLKRDIVDSFINNGIYKFVLIGENVLNFHYSDDCYYEEWYDDIKDNGGWIAGINFRNHVQTEQQKAGIKNYILFNDEDEIIEWRKQKPYTFHKFIEEQLIPKYID